MEVKKANCKSPKCRTSHVEILDEIRPAARLLKRLTSLAGLNRHQPSQRTTRKPRKPQGGRDGLAQGRARQGRSLVVMAQDRPPQGGGGTQLSRAASRPSQPPSGNSCGRDVASGGITHTNHRSNPHFLANTLGLGKIILSTS